jgi:V8-like Glu-specific endopeptidase
MQSRSVPILALVLLTACTAEAGDVGQIRSAIIEGQASDVSQDAVVLLVREDAEGGLRHCTGTLIAPRLVLTARHCVADTDASSGCRSDGTPIGAGSIRKNHAAKTLHVFTGADRPVLKKGQLAAAGRGLEILDDGAKNLCNHDIALVVLEAPIPNATIAPIRLEADVEAGERITAIGYGVTEVVPEPPKRQQRSDVEVAIVGPGRGKAAGDVAPNEFQVGESICSGDSGSPAIAARSGAVVGVAARGGNSPASSTNPAAKCLESWNFYTKTAPFKDLLLQGFALVESEPLLEGAESEESAPEAELEPAPVAAPRATTSSCAATPIAVPARGDLALALGLGAFLHRRRVRRGGSTGKHRA